MKYYNSPDNPEFLNNYMVHQKVVKMLAERTIEEYCLDIRLFLKYVRSQSTENDISVEDIVISDMTEDELRKITVTDIYNFLFYAADDRKNNQYSRYRKTSSLRSFFKYLNKVAHIRDDDPSNNLDVRSPKIDKPKFLSLDESLRLLRTADSTDSRRDYCILTLFLNCGMRLSELIGINISDLDFTENRLMVTGKGSKKRMIYLNEACIDALNHYLEIRLSNEKAQDEPALFISQMNRRISKRRVQQIVDKAVKEASLDGKGITTHKLRHTAATLMYQYGAADVLTLKKLLGHESIATTEIYTHLNDDNVRNAFEGNPLAGVKSDNTEK